MEGQSMLCMDMCNNGCIESRPPLFKVNHPHLGLTGYFVVSICFFPILNLRALFFRISSYFSSFKEQEFASCA